MKAYVITTGIVFALLVVAHVLRMFVEGRGVVDPFYIAVTVIAAALALWALREVRVASRKV
jgi:hypothetical protein